MLTRDLLQSTLGAKSHFNSLKNLGLRDLRKLAPDLEAKKYLKRVTNPGCLSLKLPVHILCQEP